MRGNTILALDLSVKETGWAVLGEVKTHGTYSFDAYRTDFPALWDALERWATWLIEMYKPAILVLEKPVHRGFNSDCLMGMSTVARLAAFRSKVRIVEVHPSSLKKDLTGSGKAKKPEVIAAVQELGWRPNSDNDADAIALAIVADRAERKLVGGIA